MALREVLRWPDPRLSSRCAPVAEIGDDIRSLASDMLETMYAAPGRGLAAPQVGVLARLFVMDVAWKDGAPEPFVCLNPEILAASETRVASAEGCLSIPGVTAEVTRPDAIRLRWTGLDGVSREADLEGFAARCAQHEIDHLDGIVTFDRVPPTERARLQARYDASCESSSEPSGTPNGEPASEPTGTPTGAPARPTAHAERPE